MSIVDIETARKPLYTAEDARADIIAMARGGFRFCDDGVFRHARMPEALSQYPNELLEICMIDHEEDTAAELSEYAREVGILTTEPGDVLSLSRDIALWYHERNCREARERSGIE